MPKPYVINIADGTGSERILNGDYAVSASVTGYDDTTILPITQNVSAGTNSYAFTIASAGTLTLHVSEDGTSGGTPVVGATFARCDSGGTVYGSAVTSDSSGDAVFHYVPFAATGAPAIYYKQTSSDGDHEFSSTLVNTTMTASTQTIEVTNTLAAQRTITLTDEHYANLPIVSGSITLS
jgi:hypothetical protein